MLHEYSECAQHFKKRLGLYQDDVDLVVMRNVVMSPWPTDGNFIAKLIGEFRKVLEEEVEVCRARNDVSPTRHEFLLLGTDKLYVIHFPAFYLEKHRHQLIMEVKLPDEAKQRYLDAKKGDPSANFVLRTSEDVAIGPMVKDKTTFEASIYKGRHSARDPDESTSKPTLNPHLIWKSRLARRQIVHIRLTKPLGILSLPTPNDPKSDAAITTSAQTTLDGTNPSTALVFDIPIQINHILKDKSLRGRPRDRSYPTNTFAFYLFGTPQSLCIGHILVRASNTQLTAKDITLDFSLPEPALRDGAILLLHDQSEAAMQPFQSTQGPLSDTLGSESNFLFRPGQSFRVTVFEDPNAFDKAVPGLLEGIEKGKVLGEGTMTLGQGRYVDSFPINKDPFEVSEGTEKFKKWKEVLDSIGKELA